MSIKHKIKVDVYKIVSEAVENGIAYGYRRSFKHTYEPDEETIKDQIYQGVMNELCEVIEFNDDEKV